MATNITSNSPTLDELKKKYASQYSDLASAMSKATDANTYNELKTLRDYKLGTMANNPNAATWAKETIATNPNANFTVNSSGVAVDKTPVAPVVTVQPSTTDLLIQQYLNNILSQKQNQADFNNYIASWKPDMSQQQFVDTAVNAITSAENTKYDNSVAAIRKRVANILAGLNSQLAALPSKYQSAYDQNTKSAYNQMENIKQIMARRGLLTSGIDVGNQKQTENTYNAAAQDITAQLNADKTNLTNQINTANSDAEADIAAAETARQDAIAAGKTQAAKDYIDYVNNQKQFAADNFWKGANYNLDAQKVYNDLLGLAANYAQGQQQLSQDAQQFNAKLQQDAEQFAASNGLEWAKLNQQDKQFYTELAENKRQFDAKSQQDAEQFAAQMGFNYAQLKENGRQFDARLGFDYADLEAQNTRAANSLVVQLAQMQFDSDTAKDRLTEEKRQFDEGMKIQIKDMDLKTQAFYQAENDRVDNMLGVYFDNFGKIGVGKESNQLSITEQKQKQQVATQIITAVSSSNLPESVKQEKYKMIEEITGAHIKSDNVRGYTKN